MTKPQKAVKRPAKVKICIGGPAKSGKTFTALTIAEGLDEGKGVLVVELERATEEGIPAAAERYADRFNFDIISLDPTTNDVRPLNVAKLIREYRDKYDVLVVDSASPVWHALLDLVDETADRTGNKFSAWRIGTPQYQNLIRSIVGAPCHVIVTVRLKQKYDLQPKEGSKRLEVVKMGLEPIQRDDFEYEFDLYCVMDMEHTLYVRGARDPDKVLEGSTFPLPGDEFVAKLKEWV